MNQVPKPANFGRDEVPPGVRLHRELEQLGEEKFVEMLIAGNDGYYMFFVLMDFPLCLKARNKVFDALLESGDLHSVWLLYASYDQPAKEDRQGREMPKRKRLALLRTLRKSGNSEYAGLVLVHHKPMSKWNQENFAWIAAQKDWDSGFVLENHARSPNVTDRVKTILLGKAGRLPSAA